MQKQTTKSTTYYRVPCIIPVDIDKHALIYTNAPIKANENTVVSVTQQLPG